MMMIVNGVVLCCGGRISSALVPGRFQPSHCLGFTGDVTRISIATGGSLN